MKPAVIIQGCNKEPYLTSMKWCRELFKRYWPKALDWPIYEVNSAWNIRPWDKLEPSWSARLLNACNTVSEEHILYFQEDFFLRRVHSDWLEHSWQIHLNYDNDITKLAMNYEFAGKHFALNTHQLPMTFQDKSGPYMMSHQPVAFFKKSFLMPTLQVNRGPSEHEMQISEKISAGIISAQVMCIGHIYNPNKSDIIHIEHGINKGEYLPNAVAYLKEEGLWDTK